MCLFRIAIRPRPTRLHYTPLTALIPVRPSLLLCCGHLPLPPICLAGCCKRPRTSTGAWELAKGLAFAGSDEAADAGSECFVVCRRLASKEAGEAVLQEVEAILQTLRR